MIYTNGLYDVDGIMIFGTLFGRIVSGDTTAHKVGEKVRWPRYNNIKDRWNGKVPQFIKKKNVNNPKKKWLFRSYYKDVKDKGLLYLDNNEIRVEI